jgi:hypothetical protein
VDAAGCLLGCGWVITRPAAGVRDDLVSTTADDRRTAGRSARGLRPLPVAILRQAARPSIRVGHESN